MADIRDDVEALSAQLRADLAGVSRRIDAVLLAVLDAWPAQRRAARRAALRQLQRAVTALAAEAGTIAHQQLGPLVDEAWRLGGRGMALTAGRAAAFGGADTSAIAAMAADTYTDVLAATVHLRESTKTVVRTLAREHVADALVTGEGMAPASRALERSLTGRGISAITYADGSEHLLGDYTDMLIRTKTAEAHQQGGFQQAQRVGIEYLEILDGPGCGLASHKDPRKANGLILPLDEARQHPLSHPRCRRVTTGRPDLRIAEQARAATPIGPQFSAADIAAGHADPSRTTAAMTAPATVRGMATAKRAKSRTVAPGGVPKAVRAHQSKARSTP